MSSSKLLLLCFALMMAEGFSQLDCNEEMLQQPIPKILNFCGPGNVSISGELGYFVYIDQCCETHDSCSTTWEPHQFDRGLENPSEYTLSDCSLYHNAPTKPMAADLEDIGIRVVAIAPGIIETPVNDQIARKQEIAVLKECIPIPNRHGHPDEFAQLVQTIVANPYINATTIELSAGLNTMF